MKAGEPAVFRTDKFVEAATWFGPEDRPLFGWVTSPASGQVRGAVVLCSPFGEEASMAHRTFRTLAQALASEGVLVLRYDHDGTGDSAGQLNDPGRVEAWVGGLRAAVELARELSAGGEVQVVGLRMGATLAVHAQSVEDLNLRSLVLWDPCGTGRGYLRELKMLQAPWLVGRTPVPPGAVETPSYQYSAATVEAVGSLALDASVLDGLDVVLLERSDRRRSRLMEELVESLGLAPVAIDEQAGLLGVSATETVTPVRTIDLIVEQITERFGATTSVAKCGATTTSGSFMHSGPDGNRTQITESVTTFDGGALFAVVTEGADDRWTGSTPCFVFVNVAAESHIGPGRLWVRLARDLAVRGYRSVRLDQSGVGDSPSRPGQLTDLVYAPAWLDDVPAVIDELRSPFGVVLVGLCSSGNSVFEATLRTQVDAAFVVNPYIQGCVDVADQHLLDRTVGRRALRPIPRPISKLMVRHRRAGFAIWRTVTAIALARSPMSVPWAVVRRGTDLVVVVGDEDREPFTTGPFWRTIGGWWLRRTGRYRLIEVPEADHGVRIHAAREAVAGVLLEQAERWAAGGRGVEVSSGDEATHAATGPAVRWSRSM